MSTSVVVVGGGVLGATLALSFRQSGHQCTWLTIPGSLESALLDTPVDAVPGLIFPGESHECREEDIQRLLSWWIRYDPNRDWTALFTRLPCESDTGVRQGEVAVTDMRTLFMALRTLAGSHQTITSVNPGHAAFHYLWTEDRRDVRGVMYAGQTVESQWVIRATEHTVSLCARREPRVETDDRVRTTQDGQHTTYRVPWSEADTYILDDPANKSQDTRMLAGLPRTPGTRPEPADPPPLLSLWTVDALAPSLITAHINGGNGLLRLPFVLHNVFTLMGLSGQ